MSSFDPQQSAYHLYSSKQTGDFGFCRFLAFKGAIGDLMVGEGMTFSDGDDEAYRYHRPDGYIRGFELLDRGGDGSAGRREVLCFVRGGMSERNEGAGLSSSGCAVFILSESPDSNVSPFENGSVLSGRSYQYADVDFERDLDSSDNNTVPAGRVETDEKGWLTIKGHEESDLPTQRFPARHLGVPHRMSKPPPSIFDQKHPSHMSNPDSSQGLTRSGFYYAFRDGTEGTSQGMRSQRYFGVQPVVPRPATVSSTNATGRNGEQSVS